MRRLVMILMILALTSIVTAQEVRRGSAYARIDTPQPYIGQPIVYTVTLRVLSDIEDAEIAPPDFAGFGQSAVILPPETRSVSTESGVYTETVQAYILFPLQAGEYEISPYQIVIPDTAFAEGEIISSNAITVTIRPLPEGAPDSYRNAVGQFEVSSELSASTAAVGDDITLTMSISGSGNLDAILAPRLELSDAWRPADNPSSDFQQDTPEFGTKTFTWTLFPLDAGTLEIPPIAFSFFNPDADIYETRWTNRYEVAAIGQATNTPVPTETATDVPPSPEPVASNTAQVVEVEPSATLTEVVAATEPPTATTVAEVASPAATDDTTTAPATPITGAAVFDETLGQQLGLKPVPDISGLPVPDMSFWLLWLIAPLLTGVLYVLRRIQSARVGVPISGSGGSSALRHAYNRLKDARLLDNPKEAYETVNDTIMQYLSRKAGTPISETNLDEYIQILSEDVQERLLYCLREAETGMYAPVADTDVTMLISRTRQSLREVDKEWHS